MNYMHQDPSGTPSGSGSGTSSGSNARSSYSAPGPSSGGISFKTPERPVAGGSRYKQPMRNGDSMDVDTVEHDGMGEDRSTGDVGNGKGKHRASRIGGTSREYHSILPSTVSTLSLHSSSSGSTSTLPAGSSSSIAAQNSTQSQAQANMNMSTSISRSRSSHLRGPSRTHIPPVPVYNGDPAGGTKVVPLPASTGGTINTTLNPNGTVTTTQVGYSHSHSLSYGRGQEPGQMGKGPLTPTSDKSFDQSSGSGAIPLDLKTLMSPPTPAPSPTPGRNGWWGTVARDGSEGGVPGGTSSPGDIAGFDPAQLLMAFPSLPPPTRLRLLEDLLPMLSMPELLMLNSNIGPRLKKDFLKDLPIELALHVLSFIDDPTTLARASSVSKSWHRLLQDEKTWKGMCERHRFQTAEVLPAIPVLTPTRNVPNSALIAGGRPGSNRSGGAIPSSTNGLTPQFSVSNPDMFSANRVARNSGVMQLGEHDDGNAQQDEDEGEDEEYDEEGYEDEDEDEEQVDEPVGMVYSAFGQQAPSSQAQVSSTGGQNRSDQYQAMPGSYHITSTQSAAPVMIDPAAYTGRVNGQLPPMPSIVSPSAVTSLSLQGQQFHLGLGLNQTGTRSANTSNTVSPFNSASYTNRPISTNDRDGYDHDRDGRGGGFVTEGMVASTSSQSGFGRSASVPEPILMTNRRNPIYGSKRPEEIDTEAPGFSYKSHFKKAYLTESAWLRGGRLLSTHTSTDEGVVTTLAMNTNYIVIGMANTKIHLFEAERGKFIRTFAGHELGVWALYLVDNGPPPTDGFSNDDLDMDETYDFNMGAYSHDQPGRSKARKRSRGDTRRASFDESNYRAGQSSHHRNGSSSQHNRSDHTQPGAYNPNGPFGPRYPGVQSYGNRWKTSDTGNAAYGWGQKQQFIVSGGCDRDVKVWDIDTGECLHTLHGHTSTIRCIKVLDGRPVAVSGARDASLRVWDIEKGISLHHLIGHTHSVRCIEIAGHYCVSGSYDCTARIWNLETGDCLQVLRGHYHQIYDIAFDGEKVATGSLDSTVRIWSAATGECVALLQGHTSLVGQLRLCGDILVTGGSDGRVIIFDLSTYTCLQRICAHDNSVTTLQFDDRFIMTGGNDGRVKLWDIRTGNFIRELSVASEAVWKVTFKNDKCAVLCKRSGKTVLELLTFVPEEFSV